MEVSWLVINRKFVTSEFVHVNHQGKPAVKPFTSCELLEFIATAPLGVLKSHIESDRSLEPVLVDIEKKYEGNPEIQEALVRRKRALRGV